MRLSDFIGEATEYDKKEMLEERKPKSWLKSVSAFANGIGGVLIFGVSNDEFLVGLDDAKSVSEKISEAIKTKMDPIPEIVMEIHNEDGKEFVVLKVFSGRETPYYYIGDGNRISYVRVGNESIPADAAALKRLVIKGSNTTYDSLSTRYKFSEFAFTKLKSVYRQRTRLELNHTDFLSFGLVDEEGMLTNAGALLTDESPMRHSRLFCTRWYGLDKASGIMEALDDKEISGSLITHLQAGEEFVKNNTKKRWKKTSNGRIEMPEYPERAVLERRGSGFKKIKDDYRHAVNYRPEAEPKFYSDVSTFKVTLYNLNYNVSIKKVLVGSEKVVVDSEKVLNASQNLSMQIAIDRLNANKNTKGKAKKLFEQMGFDGIFGRTNIIEITGVSITAAGNLITNLKSAELIIPVSGYGNGKYKFAVPKK